MTAYSAPIMRLPVATVAIALALLCATPSLAHVEQRWQELCKSQAITPATCSLNAFTKAFKAELTKQIKERETAIIQSGGFNAKKIASAKKKVKEELLKTFTPKQSSGQPKDKQKSLKKRENSKTGNRSRNKTPQKKTDSVRSPKGTPKFIENTAEPMTAHSASKNIVKENAHRSEASPKALSQPEPEKQARKSTPKKKASKQPQADPAFDKRWQMSQPYFEGERRSIYEICEAILTEIGFGLTVEDVDALYRGLKQKWNTSRNKQGCAIFWQYCRKFQKLEREIKIEKIRAFKLPSW